MEEKLKNRCDIILLSLLEEETASQWWHSRNKAFDMLTPQEMWDSGQYNRVYGYLLDQINGDYL